MNRSWFLSRKEEEEEGEEEDRLSLFDSIQGSL